ncbi:MAG: metalloregulator ArsR/SmtB family transcription factor [Gemmatimonadota bacterium]
MDPKTAARCQARAHIIKALAHPTRVFLMEELARGERCVCELTGMVGADTSTVSKHLSLLKAAGLVQDEKRGTMVYYHLRIRCALGFLDCVESMVRSVAEEQLELVNGR